MSELQERRERLAAALESGEYKQTTNGLRIGNKYCCLGVACEQFRQETNRGKWSQGTFGVDGVARTSSLPQTVSSYYGFRTAFGDYGDNTRSICSLIHDNDERGKSFTEIAQIIRNAPEGLLTMEET